jgi:hypothetical protein
MDSSCTFFYQSKKKAHFKFCSSQYPLNNFFFYQNPYFQKNILSFLYYVFYILRKKQSVANGLSLEPHSSISSVTILSSPGGDQARDLQKQNWVAFLFLERPLHGSDRFQCPLYDIPRLKYTFHGHRNFDSYVSISTKTRKAARPATSISLSLRAPQR